MVEKERNAVKGGQLVPSLICPKINLTGKRAEYTPKSFKCGPCEFITLLSHVYLTEYIIHCGTSFNLPKPAVSSLVTPNKVR